MNRSVSVIVPCFNEEKTISLLLQALVNQTYPLSLLEVVIADGLSTDQTIGRIEDFSQKNPGLKILVVENSQRNIPSGLNCALRTATGEIVVRLDAHSAPRDDFIARCVAALEKGLADNVGGVWEIHPAEDSWQARGIAAAAAHPLGVGDAFYRFTGQAKYVDTVPFGSFFRSLIDKIGFYDESLLANEDYEFNVRIRQNGGKIWLDPEIRSTYYSRANLSELARQYRRYGYWKAKMIQRYPGTIRWRQALPPVFVISLIFLGLLSIWLPVARWIIVLELFVYFTALLAAGIQVAKKKKAIEYIFSVPLAIATMHLSWGSAFLWSLLSR